MNPGAQYEVISVLGSGGFGTVYRAKFVGEGGFAKEVALKVLNPDVEGISEVAGRLRDEARILGLLRHRAIVQVDRLTMLEGRWTVVMEYVEGQDLSAVLKKGPVPPGAALEIVAEVAGALHAAYSRPGSGGQPLRLLHRDLKPSNIRITPFGEVKVLDFGIARAEFDAREAATRSLSFGTPDYMSPERLDMHQDGPEGDVYSLGVILYEMVTRVRLHKTSANQARHEDKLRTADAVMAQARLPEPLRALIHRCLAYNPGDRPTAGALEAEAMRLARGLGGEPLRSWAANMAGGEVVAAPVTETLTLDLTGTILAEGSDATLWEPTPARPGGRTPPPKLVPGQTTVTPMPGLTPRQRPADGTVFQPRLDEPTLATPTAAPDRRWIAAIAGLALLGFVGGVLALREEETPTPATVEPTPAPTAAPATQSTAPAAAAADPPAPDLTAGPAGPTPGTPTPQPPTGSKAKKASSSQGESSPAPHRPPAAKPDTEEVRLAGDVSPVRLEGAASCTLPKPCQLPAGRYTTKADFGDGTESSGGAVTIPDAPDGAPVTVRCESSNAKCVVE